MSMNIRFPNITAETEKEQITQIKSYLHQLVEQLNWVLGVLETNIGSASGTPTGSGYGDISEEMFYELKSLLIQSSDTLNAYYEKINSKLEGQYVSQKEFEDHEDAVDKKFTDLADQFVGQDDFGTYKDGVSEQFEALPDQYVSQESFNTYKQEVSEQFEGLDKPGITEDDFNTYKQEVSDSFDALAEQYVAQSDFDTYKQENSDALSGLDDKYVLKAVYDETISALQQSIEELQKMIDPDEETGGEENG